MKRLLFLTVATAALALAQNTASLAGGVTDATGHPLRKAAVTLRNFGPGNTPSTALAAETDTDGKFSFDALPPGNYTLSSERSGYLQKLARPTVTLAAGQHSADVILTMIRAIAISGKVTDADGDPVAGVTVTLLRRAFEGDSGFMIERSAYTDAGGKYEIPGIAPADYYLTAGMDFDASAFQIAGMRAINSSASDQLTNPTQPPQFYTTTYYPGETDRRKARVIAATQNDVQGIDIRLRTTPAFRLKGKVTGTVPDQPSSPCQVAIAGAYAPGSGVASGFIGFRPSTLIAKDSTFDFKNIHFIPGDYSLVAFCHQGISEKILAREPLTIRDRNIDDAVLNLQPLIDLHGTVAIEGQPGLDFSARSDANPPRTVTMQIGLTFAGQPRVGNSLTTHIQSDGSFTIPGVAPGNWSLVTNGTPGTYVKSIRLGDREVSLTNIPIDAITAATPLQIILNTARSTITGIAQTPDGKPAPGSTITIVSVPHVYASWTMTTGSDRNGRFATPGLPPGTYRVYAWEDPETAQRYDADTLSQYENQSATVTLKENDTAQVTLHQIPSSLPH